MDGVSLIKADILYKLVETFMCFYDFPDWVKPEVQM